MATYSKGNLVEGHNFNNSTWLNGQRGVVLECNANRSVTVQWAGQAKPSRVRPENIKHAGMYGMSPPVGLGLRYSGHMGFRTEDGKLFAWDCNFAEFDGCPREQEVLWCYVEAYYRLNLEHASGGDNDELLRLYITFARTPGMSLPAAIALQMLSPLGCILVPGAVQGGCQRNEFV